MNNKVTILPGLLLGISLLFGGTATAQTCKGKTWTPDSRYQVNNDEVYDTETKLTWQRCLLGMRWNGNTCVGRNTEVEWLRARELARQQAASNWRMPNIDELATLRSGSTGGDKGTGPTNSGCWDYALNRTIFPEADYAHVWSYSPNAQWNKYIGYVYFRYGNISFDDKNVQKSVRLVKGAPYSGLLIKSGKVIRAEDAMPW